MAIRMICETCGGDNLLRDAWVAWNVETQTWAAVDLAEAYCNDCHQECNIVERPAFLAGGAYRIRFDDPNPEISGRRAVFLREVEHMGQSWLYMDVYGRSAVCRYLVKTAQIDGEA